MPAIIRQNIHWWHPNALTILFVVLTFFFLDRDQFRLGKSFYLAACMCGMAAAIKLMGFFFFLTIPVYLLISLVNKKISLRRVLLSAGGFVLVFGFTILLSNPFLFYSSQREKMIEIQTQKQVIMDQGFLHDDPYYYQKGPYFWQWTLEQWYGRRKLLIFAGLSLLPACLWGKESRLNLLILSWCLPLSLYLLYRVAPKPDHYWLPVMIPLFSGILGFLPPFETLYASAGTSRWVKWGATAGLILVGVILLVYLGGNLQFSVGVWMKGNLANKMLGY